MVHPNTILESLKTVCASSSALPSSVTYATVELDAEGEHSNVSLPIIEFSIENIDRDTSRNTEKVGHEYDSDDNQIGYVYQSWFEMDVNASVVTASGGDVNHRDLDQTLRQVLVEYDDRVIGNPLPDPSDTTVDLSGISEFRVGSIAPNHDFSMSPTMRGRVISLEIDYIHEYYTTDIVGAYDYLQDVQRPDVTVD